MRKVKVVLIVLIVCLAIIPSNSEDKIEMNFHSEKFYDYLEGFIGKTIHDLVIDLSKNGYFYKERYFLAEPDNNLTGCGFIYENGIEIILIPDKIKHVERKIRPNTTWNFEEFQKDTISKIEIWWYPRDYRTYDTKFRIFLPFDIQDESEKKNK
jgi:hypothetical protein